MNQQEFTKSVKRTESVLDTITTNPIMLNVLLELLIASGNKLDQVKKNVFYKKAYNLQLFDKQDDIISQSYDFFRPSHNFLTHVTEEKFNKEININPRIFHGLVGIITESTEMVQALKNALETNKIDMVNLKEEIGDLAYYLFLLMDATNLDWNEILERNIAKLKARFPNKFSSEDAINRDLERERSILEGKVD